MPRIVHATTEAQVAAVRLLFAQYAASLGIDLSFQGFDAELEGLPGQYSAPRGALLLAEDEAGEALGCVGLRPFDWPETAELKRLYVAPGGRGLGLGSELTRAALETARIAGYSRILLDTLPSMRSAQKLYERFGFRDVAAYRYNPVDATRFMELRLTGEAGVLEDASASRDRQGRSPE